MISCNIAQKLTELRAEKGLTQGEVAAALSVSDKTLSKWENGASAPDLDMLIALANYYGVTTDTLLGLSAAKQSAEQRIDEELRATDRTTLPAKLFSLVQSSFPATMHNICHSPEATPILPPLPPMPRCMISTNEFFHFSVCSNEVNFAVLQLPNRANFSWLADTDKQAKISRLLSLLAQPDAMTLLHFLYSRACSDAFTADYIVKNTSIPTERSAVLLEELSSLNVCHKTVAHRLSGEVTLYEFHGAGLVLSILSLAYEKTCGQTAHQYCYGGGGKLIGGERA